MFGPPDDKTWFAGLAMVAIAGWAVITFVLWLLSHISIVWK